MDIINTLTPVLAASAILVNVLGFTPSQNEAVLAKRSMSLENRYPENKSVNEVFKDNILLTIAYMDKKVADPKTIDWYDLNKPFQAEFILKPQETFTFHDDIFAEYEEKVVKTTNAHFNAQEGFKFSGSLFGDGVCHLASLLYWAAKDAGLEAKAPVNHNFREIPEIPREYGVSIYSIPGQNGTNAQQNLYITNTRKKPVVFRLDYDGKSLIVTTIEAPDTL